MNIRSTTRFLHTTDLIIIGFGLILSLINLVFAFRIPNWWVLIAVNLAATILIVMLAYFRHTTGSKILKFTHDWYVAPVVFFSFKELYFMIKPIHLGKDYDDLLMSVDQWIFGVNPTEWIMQFSTPWLTEVLQIAYTSFYFLFLMLGYEFYRRHNLDLFHFFMFTCVYGFFLSYVGYFFLPAVGPRFTLHDFSMLNTDLPGIWLTPALRWFVNAGGSVPMDVANEVAIAGTQRDVFPSGHTMMTLVMMYLCWNYKAKIRYFMYVVGSLLIVATVYQRYHYVIDLVGGALFMAFAVYTSPRLYGYLTKTFETMESRFPASKV